MKAAVDATHDQNLQMALGQLYVQNKDTQDAIAQFQAASKQAWNDPSVHQNLGFIYTSMKRPDLAAQERALAQQIQKRQAQSSRLASRRPVPRSARRTGRRGHGQARRRSARPARAQAGQ